MVFVRHWALFGLRRKEIPINTRRDSGGRQGERGRDRQDGRSERQGRRPIKQRPCRFCEDKIRIDYKDVRMLERLLGDTGKILKPGFTGTCQKHQRQVKKAIKRARHLALLPYSREHVAGAGGRGGRDRD